MTRTAWRRERDGMMMVRGKNGGSFRVHCHDAHLRLHRPPVDVPPDIASWLVPNLGHWPFHLCVK